MSHHCHLTKQGYLVKKDQVDDNTLKEVRKELTVSPLVFQAYQDFVKPVKFEIFQESPNYLYLPRYYGIDKFGPPKKDSLPEGTPISLSFRYDLRPHQINAYSNTMKALREKGGGVLQIYCGAGKTAMAIKMITELGRKALIITNKEFLMDQWIESIHKFIGPHVKIGIIQQDKCEVKGNEIVMAMIHTICKKDYPQGTFDDFGTVVCDEVQHLGSEMFSQALPKIACRYTLGLSATPNRKDGLSHVFYKYLGPVCHAERRTGSNRVIVKRLKLTSHHSAYESIYMANGVRHTSAMITNLADYDVRNHLVLEAIRILMKQDRKILVLGGRRSQLKILYDLLEASSIQNVHGKKITFGYYYGNQGASKKAHRKMLAESAKCDVVLGTHAVAAEGLDLPDLNTEIFATPVTDVEQSVGRILRKFHEKINPVVVDLVDGCGNFPRQAATRAKFYRDEDYEVQDLKMPLGDTINELQPHLRDVETYLLDTNFQEAKFRAVDEETGSDEETCPQGQCFLDDDSTPQMLPAGQPPIQPKFELKGSPSSPKGKCLLDEGDILPSVSEKKTVTPVTKQESHLPPRKGRCLLDEDDTLLSHKEQTATPVTKQAPPLPPLKGKCLLDEDIPQKKVATMKSSTPKKKLVVKKETPAPLAFFKPQFERKFEPLIGNKCLLDE